MKPGADEVREDEKDVQKEKESVETRTRSKTEKVQAGLERAAALAAHEKAKDVYAKALNSLKNSEGWKTHIEDGIWNKLSDDDKMRLYRAGKPTILRAVMNNIPVVSKMKNIVSYEDPRLKFLGAGFASSARSLVQMGLLKKPNTLSDKELHEDMTKDPRRLEKAMDGLTNVATKIVPKQYVAPILAFNAAVQNLNSAREQAIKEGALSPQ